MEKSKLKHDLLKACIEAKEKTKEEAEKMYDDAQNSAKEYGQAKDRYDPYKSKMNQRREIFFTQLEKTKQELNVLSKIKHAIVLDKVAFGAIVFTDKQNFFISTACGKIQLNEFEFVTMSVQVPIFEAMNNKLKGENFEFRGIKYQILDII